MKNLSRTFLCATLLTGLAGAAAAGEVSGILMTTMCSAKAKPGGQEAAAKHERTCNLKENCAKTGFGVFTADNKFVSFDAAGNKMAIDALEASTKNEDMKVTVTGEINGSTMKVATIKLAE